MSTHFYISFSYSNRDWCISELLSTHSCGIFSTHLQWRNIASVLAKGFRDFIVPYLFKHCFKPHDLLSSKQRLQESFQKDI